FNVNLGQPGCLTGIPFYYGLDNNKAANQIDLVTVVLHELGHGVGFSGFASVTTGAQPGNLFDTTTGKNWSEMTNAERVTSAINSRHLVWEGPHVHDDAPHVLQAGTPVLQLTAPPAIAGVYSVGTATFGPPLTVAGVVGQVAQALDA